MSGVGGFPVCSLNPVKFDEALHEVVGSVKSVVRLPSRDLQVTHALIVAR